MSRIVDRLRTSSDSVMEYKSYLLSEKGKKKIDAVVFGDSRIMSLNAQYVSEHVSNALGEKFELYNFSMPNHGVRAYYLLLQKYLRNHSAPQYILFSSAMINLSGDWGVRTSVGRSEMLHRLCQLYSLKELKEVLPFKTFLVALTVKAERMSFVVLYRALIKKLIFKVWKEIINNKSVNLKHYFIDTMSETILSCARYNGGVIYVRNKKVTEEEIKHSKYYDSVLLIDEDMDYWYQKFFVLAREHGIKVLLVNAPVYRDIFQNNERNGNNQTYRQVVNQWQIKYDNVEVVGPLLQPYVLENFSDWQHLNVIGTRQFTFSVTDYLIEYLKHRD
ncbi:MAG: DUF1574 family protein [Candidatus Omnitrophota bacterium]